VSRYLFGGFGLEYDGSPGYYHSSFAYETISAYIIGEMSHPENLLAVVGKMSNIENIELDNAERKSLGASKEPMDISNKLVSHAEGWKIIEKDCLSEEIVRYSISSSLFKIPHRLKGLTWMGKHVLINFMPEFTFRKLYTFVLCLSDYNQIITWELLRYFESIMEGDPAQLFCFPPASLMIPNGCIPLIIKKYANPRGLADRLFDLPIEQPSIVLEGPIGTGLELGDFVKGTHVLLAAGTGLLPFLDWIHYLLLASMYFAMRTINNDYTNYLDIFHEDYDKRILPDFKMKLLGSFSKKSDIIGLNMISKLAEISNLYNLNLFEAKIKGYEDEHITAINGTFDEQFLRNNISLEVERVYICGPAGFVTGGYKKLIDIGFKNTQILVV
jgi:NAD(P)H-flavin reductase